MKCILYYIRFPQRFIFCVLYQSILKEISPGISLERMMLKLKLQYFGHLMRRADSLEKTWCWEGVGEGGEGNNKGWEGWMASLTPRRWVWVNSGSWWWTGRPGVLRFMGSQRVGHDWATELNWTEWNGSSLRSEFCLFCTMTPGHKKRLAKSGPLLDIRLVGWWAYIYFPR